MWLSRLVWRRVPHHRDIVDPPLLVGVVLRDGPVEAHGTCGLVTVG